MPVKPKSSSPTNRAWQRMLSGRRLDILSPSPLDIEIEDIAHGLARVTRWNGQTKGTYGLSVAQHSLLVEGILSRNSPQLAQKWRLAGLIHDAPEYVIGDMITPFKAALGPLYRQIEARLQEAVHIRFGLPAELPPGIIHSIKRADRMAAFIEATQIAGFADAEAKSCSPSLEARQQITNLSLCLQKKQRRPFCGGLIYCLGIKVTEARTNDLTRRTASDMKREQAFLPSAE